MNANAPTIPVPTAPVEEREREEVGVALINVEEDGNTILIFRMLRQSLALGLERAGIAYEQGEFVYLARLIVLTFLVSDRNAALRSLQRTVEDLDVIYAATVAWNNRAEGVWYNTAGKPLDLGAMLSEDNFLATKDRLEMGRAYAERSVKILEQMLAEENAKQPPEEK